MFNFIKLLKGWREILGLIDKDKIFKNLIFFLFGKLNFFKRREKWIGFVFCLFIIWLIFNRVYICVCLNLRELYLLVNGYLDLFYFFWLEKM